MISLIICTHNPQEKVLLRVFEALKGQSLDRSRWELIVVDNASSLPVAGRFDLSWHPKHRFLHEEKPGLLPARLTGISKASGNILVFVDDDNLLDPGYLGEAERIAAEFPMLGAWGGSSVGVYESPPPEWIRRREYHLSVRLITSNLISNGLDLTPPWIIGAGMVVRRDVAEEYVSRIRHDPRRASLGRNGTKLLGGEDLDMSMTACEMGYYRGVFTSLSLRHLIPKTRTEPDMFLSLVEGNSFSSTYLGILRDGPSRPEPLSVSKKLRDFLSGLLLDREERRFQQAVRRGRNAAMILASGEDASGGKKRGDTSHTARE